MAEVGKFIQELKRLQSKHALETLKASSGSEFEYGRACGFHQGLEMAIRAIEGILNKSDEQPSTLEKNLRGKHVETIRR